MLSQHGNGASTVTDYSDDSDASGGYGKFVTGLMPFTSTVTTVQLLTFPLYTYLRQISVT